MIRKLVFLSTGALFGVVCMLVFDSLRGTERAAHDAPPLLSRIVQQFSAQPAPADTAIVVTGGDYLQAYRIAAAESDPDALELLIENPARAPKTAIGNLRIEALLSRLGEFDPARAAILAHRLDVARPAVVQAFQFWAESEPGQALIELASVESLALRRAVAVGLVTTLGEDTAAVRQVTGALPAEDRVSFHLDAVESLAEHDPNQALRVALDVLDGDPLRRSMSRIAAAAARLDPRAAIVQSALLPDDLRSAYRSMLTSEWARLDMEGYLAYLEEAINPNQELLSGMTLLVAADPERALEFAQQFPGQVATSIRLTAMSALAQRDPLAMVGRVDDIPPGPEREQLILAVANGYAQIDPEAALAWVRQLEPPVQMAQMAVLSTLARSDPDRALDMLLASDASPTGIDQRLLTTMVVSQLASDPARAGMVADRLLESGDEIRRQALSSLLQNWARNDADAALAWMMTNADSIDPTMIVTFASAFAVNDVPAAAALVDQVPPSMRATWIAQVAGAHASHDPHGALNWVAQYQGQDGYASALSQVINRAVRTDPRLAAQILTQAPTDVQRGTVTQVASSWAREEPSAAAGWALNLADDQLRNQAVGAVAMQWSATQPEAARRWAMALPDSAVKDQAFSSIIAATGASGQVDRSLFDSLSSDQARESALQRVVPVLARQNADAARELVDAYATNPQVRATLMRNLEANASLPSSPVTIMDSGGFFIAR